MKNSIIYTLVFLALQIIATFLVTTAWHLIYKNADMSATEMTVVMTVFSVLVIMVFVKAKWTEVSPHWLLTKQWAVLTWAVIAALGLVVPFTWLQEQMPELPNWIEDDIEMLMSNYWGYLSIGLLAPLAEEFVFRGAILRSLLTQMKPWTAIAVSALLFSLVHINPAILPGIAFHWANNSIAYIIYRTYPDPDIKLVDIFQGSQTHVYMAVFFSLLIFVPALYQLHLRMKRSEE